MATSYPAHSKAVLTDDLSMNFKRLTNLAMPIYSDDAANKAYVDASLGHSHAFGEVPGGSENTLTLAHTPRAGIALFKNMARLREGAGNDYTVSGATITLAEAKIASDVFLADYTW